MSEIAVEGSSDDDSGSSMISLGVVTTRMRLELGGKYRMIVAL